MGVYINEETQEFHLQSSTSSYIVHVLKNGQIGHLYYGRKIRHRSSFAHLFRIQPRAAESSVYAGDLAFSLDIIKQEYPGYGTSDYREPAFQLEQENGSRISDFQYESYSLSKGKPSLDGLPAVYTEDPSEADTLIFHLKDAVTGAALDLMYSVYAERGIIARSARIHNQGDQVLQANRLLSASVDFPDSRMHMVTLNGSWSRERHVAERPLHEGVQKISSARGTSSAQHNPFLALKRPETTEESGEVFGFHFVYSGNFLAQAEVDHYDSTRVTMGINPFDFRWRLEPGDDFQTPEVILAYSDEGMSGLSGELHSLYRERLVRGPWRDQTRPVLINNWEATYFDFDEKTLVSLASAAKDLGVELFVLDDGWFGRRDDDTSSLGDWYADTRKLPEGLPGLSKKITDLGMAFGLWIEPEMVNEDSELYKKHPDWIIHVPDRPSSHGRNQLTLDLSRQEVVDYLYDQLHARLSEADVSYVKWDMNRNMTEIGSAALPAGRQTETAHRYMLGVYQLYERLITAFPHVLFESCASGGCRFDPGMLYYAPQAWTSDDTDAIERLKIQYGTSIAYPLSTMGAHVSDVPNHQVHRTTSLEMRGDVSIFGMFGYEMDIRKLSVEEQEQMKQQIALYKAKRELIQKGTFHRLLSPFEGDGNRTSWMVVSENKKEALVGWYRVLAEPNPGFPRVKLAGLDPDQLYRVDGGPVRGGDELMHAGLLIDQEHSGSVPPEGEKLGDFISCVYHLEAVDEELL
ncbi:alpha-galactosidase [Alkalicoccus chagannorensis]|uniref:alpha-galactosidase n=1 Tax=Alkalicoccus chagannorensis TaxID=427072 RepID=UPI000422B6CB|nr:alpha-galactosidase [Alkalicoccus chagannorensis]